jgi:hypothetical protein
MKRTKSLMAGVLALSSVPAYAGLVTADFNGNSLGQLQGQAGGSGFTGNWAGATGPAVVSGDLVAPAATNYAVAQSAGSPQAVQAANTVTSSAGQVSRAPSPNLTGTVWFSFLVNPASTAARGGIGFNSTATTSSDPRILAVGTTLYVGYGSGSTTPVGPIQVNNQFTIGQTALVVGRIILDVSGTNDRISVWVNPDVNNLLSATPVVDSSTLNVFGSALSTITVSSYTGTSGQAAGIVDAVRVSDTASAQVDVTGVPEPTAAAAALAAGGLALARRRTRRQG